MFKKVVLAGSLILTTISYGQLRVGIESNSQYYIDDAKIKLDREKFEFDKYTKKEELRLKEKQINKPVKTSK